MTDIDSDDLERLKTIRIIVSFGKKITETKTDFRFHSGRKWLRNAKHLENTDYSVFDKRLFENTTIYMDSADFKLLKTIRITI